MRRLKWTALGLLNISLINKPTMWAEDISDTELFDFCLVGSTEPGDGDCLLSLISEALQRPIRRWCSTKRSSDVLKAVSVPFRLYCLTRSSPDVSYIGGCIN